MLHPFNVIMVLYNLVYWIPIVLPLTPVMGYRTGFMAVLAVIVFRAAANIYRNNFLTLDQAEIYPLRIPG